MSDEATAAETAQGVAAREGFGEAMGPDLAAPEQAEATPADLFAIYLVEGEVDGRDLANNRLAAEPLVTLADVIGYRWEGHILCLTPAAAARVAAIREWKSFIVVADGRRCYRGIFYPSHVSWGSPIPVILYPQLESVFTGPGEDERQPRPPECFQILEHVGGSDDEEARDVRNHFAVRRVMAAAGLLLDDTGLARPAAPAEEQAVALSGEGKKKEEVSGRMPALLDVCRRHRASRMRALPVSGRMPALLDVCRRHRASRMPALLVSGRMPELPGARVSAFENKALSRLRPARRDYAGASERAHSTAQLPASAKPECGFVGRRAGATWLGEEDPPGRHLPAGCR